MGLTLVVLLLAVHLLAMNVAAAGPLVAAGLSRSGELRNNALARRVARQALVGLAIGAVLGGGLLLAPNAGLRAALARFPASTYWFAGAELAFSAACMAGVLWAVGAPRPRRALAWGLALATASNLLYHFPPLMAVIGKLAADPRWATVQLIPRAELIRLSARPETLALWAHFVLASVATAAIAALWPARGELAETSAPKPWTRLAAVALVASLLQLPVGLWLLLASGDAELKAMMGGGLVASGCLVAGVVTALGLLQSLAAVAMGDAAPVMRRRCGGMLVIVATLMTATLATSRRAATEGNPLSLEGSGRGRDLQLVLRSQPALHHKRRAIPPLAPPFQGGELEATAILSRAP